MRHAFAKALALTYSWEHIGLEVTPRDLMNPLLMARPDRGAGGAIPEDWEGKVLNLQSQINGDIYDCTIFV